MIWATGYRPTETRDSTLNDMKYKHKRQKRLVAEIEVGGGRKKKKKKTKKET